LLFDRHRLLNRILLAQRDAAATRHLRLSEQGRIARRPGATSERFPTPSNKALAGLRLVPTTRRDSGNKKVARGASAFCEHPSASCD
jgi:hypothetical protein